MSAYIFPIYFNSEIASPTPVVHLTDLIFYRLCFGNFYVMYTSLDHSFMSDQ